GLYIIGVNIGCTVTGAVVIRCTGRLLCTGIVVGNSIDNNKRIIVSRNGFVAAKHYSSRSAWTGSGGGDHSASNFACQTAHDIAAVVPCIVDSSATKLLRSIRQPAGFPFYSQGGDDHFINGKVLLRKADGQLLLCRHE